MKMKSVCMQFLRDVLASLLRKRIGSMEPESKNRATSIRQLQQFLAERFEFRYNSLTGVTEFRPAGKRGMPFRPVDEREMNGMVVDARLRGIHCWHGMVPVWVLSNKVEAYNPFRLYMEELPVWDGTDRVTPLLQQVSGDALWLQGARCWMRSMVAQWMGCVRNHANALMPVLISDEQGMGKSTFCRQLLPDTLQAYYVDNLNLSPGASPEKKLVRAGLINLDEFDKISERRQPDLKNLLQMLSVSVYRGKRLGYVCEPRLASFIATTNSRQILTDPSGSRRFLCVEVTTLISDTPPQHKQLYAQLKGEVNEGLQDYLTKVEESEWQRRNRAYYRRSPLEDVFHACFHQPEGAEKGEWLTAAEMFTVMHTRNATALRGLSVAQLSRQLTALRVRSKHTNRGNYYYVVRCEAVG